MLCVLVDLYKSSYVVFAFHQDEICKTFWHVYSTEWTVTNRIIFFLRNSKKKCKSGVQSNENVCLFGVFTYIHLARDLCVFAWQHTMTCNCEKMFLLHIKFRKPCSYVHLLDLEFAEGWLFKFKWPVLLSQTTVHPNQSRMKSVPSKLLFLMNPL